MIYDTFMVNGHPEGPELDLLECRLTELEEVPGLVHVAVEADVDHQDHPKPFYVSEHADRYAPWKERLRIIRATGLPNAADFPDPWAREHAQREHTRSGMGDASPSDVVLHGDLDEIPNPLVVRSLGQATDLGFGGMVAFQMTWCSFAVDWVCPQTWNGTVAAKARRVETFGYMRDCRNFAPKIERAGFHLGWLGGNDAAWKKLHSFCHPELEADITDALTADRYAREGFHVDGQKMIPVDIDGFWPRYVREHRCPESWFRSRGPQKFTEDWFGEASQQALADLARETNHLCGSVIEIGSWEGRSTIALAKAVAPQTVHAVDTWRGSAGEVSEILAAERDVYATFLANTEGLNIEPHRQDWRDYLNMPHGPVRFAFIDGLHTYEEVSAQIDALLPLMVSGGILCGDDAHHPPVRQAVLERFPNAEVTATLWVARIP